MWWDDIRDLVQIDIPVLHRKLDLILGHLHQIQSKEKQMAGELDSLTASVAKNGDVTQSAVILLQGLKAALDAAIASGDMSKVQALSDQIGTQDQALSDAIVANTPSA